MIIKLRYMSEKLHIYTVHDLIIKPYAGDKLA